MALETTSTSKIRFIDCDPIGHLNNSKYLDYMLNAREDHVQEHYGFTYEDIVKQTGCTWVTVQNEIAYLKEVRYNNIVEISSKIIDMSKRTATVEILMKNPSNGSVNALLWTTVIFFNLKTRKADTLPDDLHQNFGKFFVEIPQKDFKDRVSFFRNHNKNI